MLLEHNIRVFAEVSAMLEKEDRVILVSAPGTGKSYVTEEFLEGGQKTALVVCPLRGICKQWDKLSDRVTTMTYQMFSKMSKDTRFHSFLAPFDCLVFDEAHHCGSPVWGKAVQKAMEISGKPIIGLTADSHRYSDGGRDVAAEIFGGCLVLGYSMAEAIELGILPPVTYINSLFDAGDAVAKIKASLEGKNVSKTLVARLDIAAKNCVPIREALRKHMPKNKRKGIVFADRISATEDAAQLIADVYPDAPVLVAHSDMPRAYVDEVLEAFAELDEGYIVVVDMFNEGIHARGVNTAIMLRRTCSPMVYIQQCGRAFAANGENAIIFDFVGNTTNLKAASANIQGGVDIFAAGEKRDGKHSSQTLVHNYAIDFVETLYAIQEELDDSWTEAEDEILRQFYPPEGVNVYKRLPHRTKGACKTRAQILGLLSERLWTEEEDEVLRKYYPTEGRGVSERLPGRTRMSCRRRAQRLSLVEAAAPLWTKEEDDILLRFYQDEGRNVFERLPGRTKEACRARAKKLGLAEEVLAWTKEEDAILRQYYPTEGGAVCKRLPGRARGSCKQRILRLGLQKPGTPPWTEQEDEILREFYLSEGRDVFKRLNGRSKGACQARAQKLGIITRERGEAWSEEEDEILRRYYPTENRSVFKRLEGRTMEACKGRAKKLGLTNPPAPWTEQEDDILREFYPTEGNAICKRLPGRKSEACRKRAYKLGVHIYSK